MQQVKITHNPYKRESVIEVNGSVPPKDSQLTQYLNLPFQEWVDKIPPVLAEEYNDKEFELTFHGTEEDYQDLYAAAKDARQTGVEIELHKIEAKEFGEKEKDIRKLIEEARQLPFDELQSDAVNDAIEKAFNTEFDVNVVATMSAGKSTLINALLCQKLMPSKQGACTATVTRIKDRDDASFSAISFDMDHNELDHYSQLDYATMRKLNDDSAISEIRVEGNIPFVDSDAISLILIDTPGTDNARDKRHGEVTQKALEKSSKMLVLFVMNGGKLHDDAQDRLLRTIAESMKVGGKQSRERFLFVINKMDDYGEDDNIAGETIPITVQYLEEMGIENPNIFPVAALPALNIRRYLSTTDQEVRKKLWKSIQFDVPNLVETAQLHLETYPNLPRSCQLQIKAELQEAIDNNDLLGQALIHTGIRGIEETIRMYVTKYCRPAKIKNVCETFGKALESADAFAKTQAEITSRENDLVRLGAQIKALKRKLESKTENESFRKRIEKLDISTALNRDVQVLYASAERELSDFFEKCAEKMDEDEAKVFIRDFSKLADNLDDELEAKVNALLETDIQNKGESLLNEYVRRLKNLSDEFSVGDFSIDLEGFVKGTLHAIKEDDVIDASLDSYTDSHKETRTRYVTKTRKKFNPMRLFKGAYYEVEEEYTVNVTEKHTFVSRDKLRSTLISPIRETIYGEIRRIEDFSKGQTVRLKEYFNGKFDEVDSILAKKLNELQEATSSEEAAEASLRRAEQLQEQLNDVKCRLESVLEV